MADTTLTLKELTKLIWKNLLLIVIVTALFGGLAYGTANYLLPARYTASMDFVAKGKITQGGFTKWQARSQNEQAANGFQNIAISPGVIDHTTNEIDNVSPAALRENITVCSTPRSNTYTLTVTSSSPEKAKKKLKVVAKNFKKEFNAASTGLFGSGWAWLSIDKQGKLHITKEPNGSNPWRAGLKPLLGFDVWEHAYYLDYQNRRADHVNKLWEIIDWDVVEKRL